MNLWPKFRPGCFVRAFLAESITVSPTQCAEPLCALCHSWRGAFSECHGRGSSPWPWLTNCCRRTAPQAEDRSSQSFLVLVDGTPGSFGLTLVSVLGWKNWERRSERDVGVKWSEKKRRKIGSIREKGDGTSTLVASDTCQDGGTPTRAAFPYCEHNPT